MRYKLTTKGSWTEQKKKLGQKFNLTDADLAYDEGKKEEMMENLSIKLQKTKQELNRIINTL